MAGLGPVHNGGLTRAVANTLYVTPAQAAALSIPVYNAILAGGAKIDGSDTTATLTASFVAAQAANLPLYLPTGTYTISVAGATPLFSATANGARIIGDGIGKTIIHNAANLALSTLNCYLINSTVRDFQIEGVSIDGGGATMSGAVVTAVVVVSGGSSYVNGDTITLNYTPSGNTGNARTVLTVTNASGGVIQTGGVSLTTPGSWQQPNTVAGGGTQQVTSGSGTGAMFTVGSPGTELEFAL